MAYVYKFTEDELVELIGDDLSLPASLAALINDNGDIRSFLLNKLLEREEELAIFHLSQSQKNSDLEDWNSIEDAVEAREAAYINSHHFA